MSFILDLISVVVILLMESMFLINFLLPFWGCGAYLWTAHSHADGRGFYYINYTLWGNRRTGHRQIALRGSLKCQRPITSWSNSSIDATQVNAVLSNRCI